MRLALGAALAALAGSAAWADTLVDNVRGYTLTATGEVEPLSGIVIGTDGRVVQVLREGEKAGRTDYRIDGKGRVLLPGLVDGSARVMALGFAALTLDLSDAKTLDEAKARIAAYAAAHPDRPWLLGRGWDAARWSKAPGAADLDAVVSDRPVWLVSADGHSGWANSAAIAAAAITGATKDPLGGKVLRLPGKAAAAGKPPLPGVPTGIFTETAMALIDKVVPAPRPEDRDLALAAAQDWLIRHGVTTVTDMGTTIEDWQSLRRAGDAGRLQVRVIGYAAGTDAMSLIAGPGPTPWLYDDRLKLNGVALVLDGALSTGMAWTGASSGGARLNPTQLRNLMSRAAIDRFQVAIEAHGEAATGAALDAVAELAQTYQGDRRWRITGVEAVGSADPARFGKDISATLTGLASTTPPARDLAGANVKLASGSGGPGGLAPLSAISAGDPRQALATWTTGAAWAGMAETKVGRLAPGLRADFILLDRDPFAAGASDPAATRVTEVWIGGRKVFGD